MIQFHDSIIIHKACQGILSCFFGYKKGTRSMRCMYRYTLLKMLAEQEDDPPALVFVEISGFG
jgi:hypothetical protein